jgi:drug/metabolite transporter (DMT)-like permease
MHINGRTAGIVGALSSAVFLGTVPVFGKIALGGGFSPFSLIAVRTSVAALLLLVLMHFTMRRFFYIYPVGLLGCLLAGCLNGLGSILYYTALNKINAGVGHLLYSFYPLFVALWLALDRQPIGRLTGIRLGLMAPAVFLLVLPGAGGVDLVGAAMMLGSAVLYALHMLINQRILYEAPPQTVTLYTLLAMAVTVDAAALLAGQHLPALSPAWRPALMMALITFLSRLTLFLGIKHLGGLQTALLGLGELFVTILLAHAWLGEQLLPAQWAGAALLALTMLLVRVDKAPPQKRLSSGWLAWLNPPAMARDKYPWNAGP